MKDQASTKSNKPEGWYSRRHSTRESNEAARLKYGKHGGRDRRRRSALAQRENQLVRYSLGDYRPFEPHVSVDGKLERAQAEVNRLRKLVG